MFREEATQDALKWNLRRCKNPKRVFKMVKRDLKYKSKHAEIYAKEDGLAHCWIHMRLSKKGFDKLQEMCTKEGITLTSNWTSPYPALYCFYIETYLKKNSP